MFSNEKFYQIKLFAIIQLHANTVFAKVVANLLHENISSYSYKSHCFWEIGVYLYKKRFSKDKSLQINNPCMLTFFYNKIIFTLWNAIISNNLNSKNLKSFCGKKLATILNSTHLFEINKNVANSGNV